MNSSREHLEAKLELALEYLKSVCEQAESGDSCSMCGEVFDDYSSRELPKCIIPEIRDFLENSDGLADAIVRGYKKKNVD